MPDVLLGLVGDVFINRANSHEVFDAVRPILEVPQILFANLESVYTDDPRPVPTGVYMMHGPADNLDSYAKAGFNVVSMANNHILDCGYDAMLETRKRLRAQGVKTCGVGDSLTDAREPAIVEVDGLSVAFLAYASVFPMGYEARVDRAGLAPMRAHTFWRDPFPLLLEPGRHPVIGTVADEVDLRHLAEDIQRARGRADLVVTSFHWGDQMRPYRLTDHEKRTARFCIDEGASMVVGHHHHAIRGMEWYKGKPIMYGLGHFVFDLKLNWTAAEYQAWLAEVDPDGWTSSAPYQMFVREGWPYLPMHEDTRMTLIAWARASRGGVSGIGFLPCKLAPDGKVHPLRVHSAESAEVLRYFEQCNTSQRLNGRAVLESSAVLAGYPTLRVVPN